MVIDLSDLKNCFFFGPVGAGICQGRIVSGTVNDCAKARFIGQMNMIGCINICLIDNRTDDFGRNLIVVWI